MIIKKGAYFVISEGEYSDYSVIALCVALGDINITKLADEYRQEYMAEHHDELVGDILCKRNDAPSIANWLVNIKKIATEFNFYDFHTDWYCDNGGFFDLWGIPSEL